MQRRLLNISIFVGFHLVQTSLTAAIPDGVWFDNYSTAYNAAIAAKKTLIVYFAPHAPTAYTREFEESTLQDPDLRAAIENDYIFAKVPIDAKVNNITLISDGAFVDLLDQPGIATIDLRDKNPATNGRVTGAFPFMNLPEVGGYKNVSSGYLTHYRPWGRDQFKVILKLPSLTLEERSMVYAVRIFPRQALPCTDGSAQADLLAASQANNIDQAASNCCGHYGHCIHCEIAAPTYTDRGIIKAAIEAVAGWSGSHGHFEALKTPYLNFGFSLSKGHRSGCYWATGNFR